MKTSMQIVVALVVSCLVCAAQEKGPAASRPAPGATAATAPIPAPKDSYVIGASDVLAVTVWKQPTLTGTLLVRPDGMVSMPLLGDVQASGLTPLQLANNIETRLKKYIQYPEVTVVVAQIRSKNIYLIGEVGKKGPVEMTSGMTLLEAIASAGGLTDFANAKKIYILRTVAGKQQKIPVHYKEALKGNAAYNIALEPNDTIVVP